MKNNSYIYFIILFFLFFYVVLTPVNASSGVANSSFESGTSEWITNSSLVVFDVVNDPVREGSFSAKLTYSKTTSFGIEQLIQQIQPDQSYLLSGYMYASALPDKAFLRIAWYQSTDGSGSQISTSDSPSLSEVSKWQNLTSTITSPSNAHSAKVRVLVANGIIFTDSMMFTEFVPTQTPTPQPTSTPTPTPTLTQTQTPTPLPQAIPIKEIYISEILPQPETGEIEWIELYNANEKEITLSNWYLDDIADGGSSPRSFSVTIPSKGYKIVRLTSSMLNNTDDVARLLNDSKTQVAAVEYGESERGLSIGWNAVLGTTYCSQKITPDAPNTGCVSPSIEISKDPSTQDATITVPTPTPNLRSSYFSSAEPRTLQNYSIKARVFAVNSIEESQDSTEIQTSSSNQETRHTNPLPVVGYALLSILSIAAKMKSDI